MASHGDQQLSTYFLLVRTAIGAIGLALPLVLLFGNWIIFGQGQQASISDYYATRMGDVFVGLLCAIGIFLGTYRGYQAKDFFAGQFAGAFALLVAFFPNSGGYPEIHFGAALLFFAALAFFCLKLFRKSKHDKPDRPAGKRRRDTAYVVCGVGILVCIALIGLYVWLLENRWDWLDERGPIFWLETLAIWFFGASWIVKGEALKGRVGNYLSAEE